MRSTISLRVELGKERKQQNVSSSSSNNEETDAAVIGGESSTENPTENSTKEKPDGEEGDDGDEIEMELNLGEFNLDGACRSSPSTSPVSMSPDPVKKKDDQPMERKLLKAMLVINSLEDELLAEHNYIATNFMEKIRCIREEVGDAVTEILTLKSSLAGKVCLPNKNHNESTISIPTNNTTGESSP